MTIQQAQQDVDQWIKTVGVRYFSELTNMAILTEEVGELARHISRQFGDQSYRSKDGKPPPSGEVWRGLGKHQPCPVMQAAVGIFFVTWIHLMKKNFAAAKQVITGTRWIYTLAVPSMQ